jgi:hypothetical protein
MCKKHYSKEKRREKREESLEGDWGNGQGANNR